MRHTYRLRKKKIKFLDSVIKYIPFQKLFRRAKKTDLSTHNILNGQKNNNNFNFNPRQ